MISNSSGSAKSAIILFAHGSSNEIWREPFDAIVQQMRAQIQNTRVELAFLTMMQPNINTIVHECAEQGIYFIRIVPLFFGVGMHVEKDLRKLIKTIQNEFKQIEIEVADALGQSELVRNAIAQYAMN